ncbi:helix-turn-helix transcriptional regulator [Bacillus sp. FJAT-49711]|uniref:helix-turn-helix domain-containing protein n=1 Tax=Bacillus sp. FJAT-49711 TaxID=2833585 RepID=UPI001BC99DD1|nr:helix-turn-helix transcriptional regulator [Bacillus sp. FJAT-49711]MBS4221068.1 helix-turn-helix transcriptional regulator [Bacillus sp. FJAT-49711]
METDKWGRRIRAFRKLKGYTQEGLAKDIGISVSVLGEIERGTRLPSEDVLLNISSVLGITKAELTPPGEESV